MSEERDEVNTDDKEWKLQIHMNIVSSMTVNEFQNQLEKHKIECNTIDNYVFDLAKAIMENSDERKI